MIFLILAGCVFEKVDLEGADSGDASMCGEGTHLEDGECVPDEVEGGDDSGGTDSNDGGEGEGEGEGDTDSGAGGEGEGEGEGEGDTGTGDDYTVCGSGGAPYDDIQDAVDDAEDGDIIRICAGTYGPVELDRIDVTLIGVDGVESTVIDGGHNTAVIIEGGSVELSGLTLTGEIDERGDVGSLNIDDATVYAHDLRFAGNRSGTSTGNVILASYSDVTLEDIVVEDNEVYGMMMSMTYGTLIMRHSIWRNNTEVDACCGPLLFSLVHMDGTISNNLFYDNAGGGIKAEGASTYIDYNLSYANTGGSYGNYSFNTSGTSNIERGPGFSDADSADFGLSSSSPCVDAGDPSSSYNDVDGTRNDIGAYGGPRGDW